MRRNVFWIKLNLCLLALVFASGCATARVRSSHRKGFFDQFAATHKKSEVRPVESKTARTAQVVSNEPIDKDIQYVSLRSKARNWIWPLKSVTQTSSFGYRGNGTHEGVDLKAKVGTPVYAIQDGVVIYSGSKISGYGKLIVIRHTDDLASVYAHHSKLLVTRGKRVKRGQLIAYSGKTGRVSGPHLHFEVRKGVNPLDPFKLLPPPNRTFIAQRSR